MVLSRMNKEKVDKIVLRSMQAPSFEVKSVEGPPVAFAQTMILAEIHQLARSLFVRAA